ncbi:DUF7064 domain-containing protein [Mycobacterium shigaense]|uniref:DUF7064 domain-containing protein n=1 Tax=Mycobacterium shigaense TaxID=722731 RepID=UPI00115B6974|nr:hypothetical protein [Mycobacterium shigaense]MEA1121029.1 hypothetical protein [Mycobacterium shigaense]
MIEPRDEDLHAPSGDRHWQESFYFNWADEGGRYFGLTRIGLNWYTEQANALVIVMENRKAALVHFSRVSLKGRSPGELFGRGLRVGAVTYSLEEPLHRWRLTLATASAFDLSWMAYTPAIDFHEHIDGPRIQEHFEQSGVVEGTMTVRGEQIKVRCLGQRDKSWGLRDWNGLEGWDWLVGQFGEDLAFNATWTDIHGQRVSTGYVFAGGRVRPIDRVKITYTWDKPHRPATAVVDMRDVDGQTYRIRGRALGGRVPLAASGLWIEETHTAWEWDIDGQSRVGHGVVEHAYHVGALGTLRRLHRVLPVVALALRGAK